MALVVSGDTEREAQRIIASKNAFEVLEVSPTECSRETVLRQYDEKSTPFRRLFRNKLALQAKARLDEAKMRLLDDHLRSKELASFTADQRDGIKDRAELTALEARTRMLEMRAAALLSS